MSPRRTLWNEEIMLRSRTLLETMKVQGFEFVLIGGWAVYMISRYHMSRDIDLLMRDRDLWKLKTFIEGRGGREKAGLRKFGFDVDDVGLDVYTETRSGFPVDIAEVFEGQLYLELDGYRVLSPGRLLRLKLQAALARGASHKGLKDRCDIISVCIADTAHLRSFTELARKMDDGSAVDDMRRIIKDADGEFEYVLGRKENPARLKRMKKKLLDALR